MLAMNVERNGEIRGVCRCRHESRGSLPLCGSCAPLTFQLPWPWWAKQPVH